MKSLLLPIVLQCVTLQATEPLALTTHLHGKADLGEQRDIQADWRDGVLNLSTASAELHAWAVINAPKSGWNLNTRGTIKTDITNTGDNPVGIMLWVVGDHGWEAVTDTAVITPHQTRTFSCDLRETFPDGTPKLDPDDIKQIQVMLSEPAVSRESRRTLPVRRRVFWHGLRSLCPSKCGNSLRTVTLLHGRAPKAA